MAGVELSHFTTLRLRFGMFASKGSSGRSFRMSILFAVTQEIEQELTTPE